MIVHPLTSVMTMPDAGMLLGTTAPRHILESINEKFGGGVAFGGVGDMFAEAYTKFNQAFVQASNTTLDMLQKAKSLIINKEQYGLIASEDDLLTVPPCMYYPLLTYEPIREFHANDRIDGWGVDPDLLPDDDPFDHVIKCGLMETDEHGKFPDKVYWTWTTDDIPLTMDEKDIILESRRYMENFLAQELADGGELRDPSGFCSGLLIGELR